MDTLEPRVLFTAYWVDASVSSSGDGSSPTQAFKTIGEAASLSALSAGDVVNIQPGVYRETVEFQKSGTTSNPIVFRQAPGSTGDVVVSGLEQISSGWSVYSDPARNIFQRNINPAWDWDSGFNQIFVDGKAMFWARWPNTADVLDPNTPNWAFADNLTFSDSGNTRTVTLTEGSMPGSSFSAWGEGHVHISPGDGWVHQTGKITSATNDGSGKRLTFDVEKFSDGNVYRPETGDRFYVVGAFRALDAPGEWFIQDNGGGNHILYLRGDSNQNLGSGNIDVEIKARDTAIDFNGNSNVVLEGIDIMGARLVTGNASRNLVIDGMEARYVEHYDLIDDAGVTNPFSFKADSGVRLSGENHVFRDSTVQYSAVNGVTVEGKGHKVLRNTISDVNYVGANGAGIRVGYGGGGGIDSTTLTRHEIGFNKIYNLGRSGISGAIQGGSIHHNEIYNALMQSRDGGAIYINNVRGNGSVIAYNKIHDVFNYDGVTGGGSSSSDKENTVAGLSSDSVGIYLDNASTTASDFVIHHNVVWNVGEALRMNASAFVDVNNKVYNNTLVGVDKAVATWVGNDGNTATSLDGTVFANNILVGEIFNTDTYSRVDFFDNVYTDTATINALQSGQGNAKVSRLSLNLLNDVAGANADFRIGSGSTAREAGEPINAYTVAFDGSKPDAGAYEGIPSGGGFDVGPTGVFLDDNRGATVSSSGSTVIEAPWYDTLGGAVSYFDTNSTNPSGWREPEAVDASSFAVNNVSNGEYLDYTLDVTQSNNYDVVIAASKGSGGTTTIGVQVSDDGETFGTARNVTISSNGNWGDYRDLTVNDLALSAGFQVIRLSFDGAVNVDQFTLTPSGPSQSPYQGITRDATLPVEAEYFDVGGDGVAYNDDGIRQGNSNLRAPETVDLTLKSNAGGPNGGTTVGYAANGEWLEYTVDLPNGDYDFRLRYSSGSSNPGDVRVLVNATPIGTLTSLSNTGNWNMFQFATLPGVGVTSGGSDAVVRLEMIGGGFDLDWFQFLPVALNTLARIEAENFAGLASSGSEDWRPVTSGSPDYAWVPSISTSNQRFWNAGVGPTMSYTLSDMEAGTYDLNVRTNSDAQGSSYRGANNSFWMRVNGSAWELISVATTADWSTQTFTGLFDLATGDNLIEIAAREDGTRIDWIEFA